MSERFRMNVITSVRIPGVRPESVRTGTAGERQFHYHFGTRAQYEKAFRMIDLFEVKIRGAAGCLRGKRR